LFEGLLHTLYAEVQLAGLTSQVSSSTVYRQDVKNNNEL
jgi:hypothetical protein